MRQRLRNYRWGLLSLSVFLFMGSNPMRCQSVPSDGGFLLQSQSLFPQPQCDRASESDEFCYHGYLRLRKTSFRIAKDVCLKDDSDPGRSGSGEFCLPVLLGKLGMMSKNDRCNDQAIKALILRQQISEMILTASLQVDGFLAEIDSETNHIREVKDDLTDRQGKAVNRTSMGNNLGTTGGAVGSALALGAQAAMTAGSWVGAVSGFSNAAFGFLNYYASQRSPKGCFPGDPKKHDPTMKKNECKPLHCSKDGTPDDRACSPAMLVHLFPEVQSGTTLFHSEYDPVIDHYLVEEKKQLIQDWTASPTNPLPTNLDKLTVSNDNPQKFRIDELTERQNKLSDLRAVVSRANRDLSRLTEDLTKDQCF